MVEHRPTHRQAIVSAFKESLMMVVPALMVAGGLFYFLIFHTEAIPSGAEQAWWGAKFTLMAFPAFMIPVLTFTGWMQKRSEPTRSEIEAREREQTKRLLDKYPDLRG